jgi:hypothetical protein
MKIAKIPQKDNASLSHGAGNVKIKNENYDLQRSNYDPRPSRGLNDMEATKDVALFYIIKSGGAIYKDNGVYFLILTGLMLLQ